MNPSYAPDDAGVGIPAIDTASSTAAIRSLGRRNIEVTAITSAATAPGVRSKYCSLVVEAPAPERDLAGYEEALLELAQTNGIQTILPFREPDIYLLSRNKAALAEHVGTPWPGLDTLRQVQDRVLLFDIAASAGIPIPRTELLDDWEANDHDVIVKPRFTVHASEYSETFTESHTQWSSVQYVDPDDELDREQLVTDIGHVPLVQEFIPSADEYGFFALYDEGDAVATFQHRQRRGWKYCGGPSAYRESVAIPELEDAGIRLLDELDWHGVAMVEFLRDPATGEFKLMEVNPRFWSSLPFTVQAGVDFPSLYWMQATGQPIETSPEYEAGLAGHLLTGELLHLYSILVDEYPLVDRPSFARSALSVGASILRHPRFDYLDMDDPAPFVEAFKNTLRASEGHLSRRGSSPSSGEQEPVPGNGVRQNGDTRGQNEPPEQVEDSETTVVADGDGRFTG